MKVPFVDLAAQLSEIKAEVRAAIDSVLETCAFVGDLAIVEEFEQSFARYCGCEYCVAVGSGTAALEIVLRAYGVGPGDDVILPANTFVAAAEAISLVGAQPVFADVEVDTANVDAESVACAITARTKAILPVHLYGQPANMPSIRELARRHGLLVIEDSSQAHGATLNANMAGNLADAATFSFYPSKNLGALGEAGCLVTNDADVVWRARRLRDHGAVDKYRHELIGRNDRMDGIQAAVLNAKLPYLDDWNRRRRAAAQSYRAAIGDHSRIRWFREQPGCSAVYHLFVVRVPQRDRLRKLLGDREIATGVHYPLPLHLQSAYKGLGFKKGDFPVCESLAEDILSLPMYPELRAEQVEFVAGQLLEAVETC